MTSVAVVTSTHNGVAKENATKLSSSTNNGNNPKPSCTQDDSESDSELEYPELERRRDEQLRKLVIAEHHFTRLKTLWKNAKTIELENRRNLALNHDGPEFTERKLALDKYLKERRELIRIGQHLSVYQIMKRKVEMEHVYKNGDTYGDAKETARDKLIDQIREKIHVTETRCVRWATSRHLVENRQLDVTGNEGHVEDMKRRKEMIERKLGKPIIVCELDSIAIEEDVKHFELMGTLANLRSQQQTLRQQCGQFDEECEGIREERMDIS